MEFKHESVLLDEVIDNLNIKKDGIYVDGTLGGAGHSLEILKRLSGGTLIGIDRDKEAIRVSSSRLEEFEKNNSVYVVQSNYSNIPLVLKNLNIDKVDGILLDLGVSSYQIDNFERGFSYMHEGPLDMRMDQSSGLTAADIVNTYSFEDLRDIFFKYGEEKFSSKIAKEIVEIREEKPFNTTFDLVDVIDKAKPFSKKGHKAKQVFQALRIEVNSEIDGLKKVVESLIQVLKPKGRLAIITFHSLEDRAVKEFFKESEGVCSCPSNFPVCVCDSISYGKVIKNKFIPTTEEKARNSRAKSAVLRVFEKN